METTTPIMSSVNELSSRLKHLCPLHMVPRLNDCSDTDGARLVLDFADYLAVCGPQQCCQCDENAENISDVSMGNNSDDDDDDNNNNRQFVWRRNIS